MRSNGGPDEIRTHELQLTSNRRVRFLEGWRPIQARQRALRQRSILCSHKAFRPVGQLRDLKPDEQPICQQSKGTETGV